VRDTEGRGIAFASVYEWSDQAGYIIAVGNESFAVEGQTINVGGRAYNLDALVSYRASADDHMLYLYFR
jgi:hypothetical protein